MGGSAAASCAVCLMFRALVYEVGETLVPVSFQPTGIQTLWHPPQPSCSLEQLWAHAEAEQPVHREV